MKKTFQPSYYYNIFDFSGEKEDSESPVTARGRREWST